MGGAQSSVPVFINPWRGTVLCARKFSHPLGGAQSPVPASLSHPSGGAQSSVPANFPTPRRGTVLCARFHQTREGHSPLCPQIFRPPGRRPSPPDGIRGEPCESAQNRHGHGLRARNPPTARTRALTDVGPQSPGRPLSRPGTPCQSSNTCPRLGPRLQVGATPTSLISYRPPAGHWGQKSPRK